MKKIALLQNSLLIIAGLLVCVLAFYSRFGNTILIAIISAGIVTVNFLYFKKHRINRIIMSGLAFSFVLFLFLHNFFYPALLTYQSGMMAGKWLMRQKSFKTPAMFQSSSYSFEFYAPGYVQRLETFTEMDKFLEENDERAIYTTNSNLEQLKLQGYHYHVLATFPDFHISMLTPQFLNASTRNSQLEKIVLVALRKKN